MIRLGVRELPRVARPAAAHTDPDDTFHTCLTDTFRTFRFPEPRGGGIVKVAYPFVFKPV